MKKKKRKCSGKNNSDENSNCNFNNSNQQSRLCYFSALDYIVLASTLAIALGEELSQTDISILSTFFAVLSDELALIASVDSCTSDNTDIFVPPVPSVSSNGARRSSQTSQKNCSKENR